MDQHSSSKISEHRKVTSGLKENKIVSVLGLGRVGLPLALKFCEAGLKVYGVDINQKRIGELKKCEFPFMEKGGQELLNKVHSLLFPTDNLIEAVKASTDIILTLGTSIDDHRNPNFEQIMGVISLIRPHLEEGHHIVLRSTVSPEFPGYLINYLNSNTSFTVGKEIFLSYCPERIAEGYAIEEISKIPQIIGTEDEGSKKKASELFSFINDELIYGSTKSASAAKIMCNVSRYIMFATANDLDVWMRKLDINSEESFYLATHNYKRNVLKSPGLAAGPCLVKDGNISQERSIMYNTAEIVNEDWPLFYSKIISKMTGLQGKKVAILGIGFKAEVDDDRDSLSHKIRKFFEREYALVYMHDPYMKKGEIVDILSNAEVVIIAVGHSYYKNEKFLKIITDNVSSNCVIWDIWNLYGYGWKPQQIANYKN